MSRRKQARPIRVPEPEDGEVTTPLTNDGAEKEEFVGTDSCSDDMALDSGDDVPYSAAQLVQCDHCYGVFNSQLQFAQHEKICDIHLKHLHPNKSDESTTDDEEFKRPEEDDCRKRLKQDAENNNHLAEEMEAAAANNEEMRSTFGQLAASHVTLEALQNTKVAVAQFAATALTNNENNPAALQKLAYLQQTLFTLHHQQLMQINLINQLENQLQITKSADAAGTGNTTKESNAPLAAPCQGSPTDSTRFELRASQMQLQPRGASPPTPIVSPGETAVLQASGNQPATANSFAPQTTQLPNCSVSSSFASSIITHFDAPSSPSEMTSLEMLQKRTQEVLENASHGLLANNLADELAFRKSGGVGGNVSPYDGKSNGRNEPFFKHRCRYCGKVFGSDSALQIHIRSHTGERPFKCNVCGSRFTTKGNLKVHFQRHTSRFPHIKMNPNPVPEHLDKYHPPLLSQIGSGHALRSPQASQMMSSSAAPQFPTNHAAFGTGLPLQYRPSTLSPQDLSVSRRIHPDMFKPLLQFGPLFATNPNNEQAQPENLCKVSACTPSPSNSESSERNDVKKELPIEDEVDRPSPLSGHSDWGSMSAIKVESSGATAAGESDGEANREEWYSATEAISKEDRNSLSPYDYSSEADKCSHDEDRDMFEDGQEQPENLSRKNEPLDKSGNNMEWLLRGNSTCNICFKTFACHSALEIHYRSHTKERPYKCAVCARGFSTKGNMKQHMLTHKMKDAMGHTVLDKVSATNSVESSIIDEASNDSSEDMRPVTPSPRQVVTPIATTPSSQTQSPMQPQMQSPMQPQMQPQMQSTMQSHLQLPSSAAMQLPSSAAMQLSQLQSSIPALTTAALSMAPVPVSICNMASLPNMDHQQMHLPQKRSPDNTDLQMPLPKRPSNTLKHLCQVCNKNFSSSSALQIHMRTHTGDKPFRCTVCMKAFTTKGNLKVHMGTHMWTNGASRRGRRMSLELPSLPLQNKEPQPDLFHRRPELFYPYLPSPFMNGVHQKLHEISNIQSMGSAISNGFFPFGGSAFGGLHAEMKRASSPEKISPPVSMIARHMDESHQILPPWDLHFDRKTGVEEQRVDNCVPSPPRNSHPQEGLAV